MTTNPQAGEMPDVIHAGKTKNEYGHEIHFWYERKCGTHYTKTASIAERLGAMKRGAASEDEAMCQITSIYNEGWNAAIDSIIKEVGE